MSGEIKTIRVPITLEIPASFLPNLLPEPRLATKKPPVTDLIGAVARTLGSKRGVISYMMIGGSMRESLAIYLRRAGRDDLASMVRP